ncbi:MAG: cytochrome C oxidase subunit IV family protein [Chlamydiales bacterium]|nr:cytochrome C oxidase subunit IV family protein [Chlamydiales bacterium]
MDDIEHKWNTSLKPLMIGFFSSIILILAAYFIAKSQLLTGFTLTFTIVGIGAIQVLFQLIFFLHLGIESKPRWNLLIFLFMLLIIAVLVGGSLWIMYSLNYTLMPTMQ